MRQTPRGRLSLRNNVDGRYALWLASRVGNQFVCSRLTVMEPLRYGRNHRMWLGGCNLFATTVVAP